MIWWVLLLIFTSLVSHLECVPCDSVTYSQEQFDTVSCTLGEREDYQAILSSVECSACRMPVPTIHTINREQGEVAVEFELIPVNRSCNVIEYKFTLSGAPSNRTQCISGNSVENYSRKKIVKIIQNGTDPSCGKSFNVSFEYVREGIYKLDYEYKLTQKHSCSYNLQNVYINSSYEKEENGLDISPYITPVNYGATTVSITVTNYSKVDRADFVVNLHPENDDEEVWCETFSRGYRWYTSRNKEHQLMCKLDERHKNDHTRWVECSEVHLNSIMCTLYNFSSGNYCIAYLVDDDSCKILNSTTCLKKCQFKQHFTIPVTSVHIQAVQFLSEASNLHIGSTITFITLLLICFIILILILWKRRTYLIGYKPGGENCHFPQRTQILLLYARDCEPFMKMMITFRDMLKEITMCKVYDCFDGDLVEVISQGKVDWIQHQISNSNMKIVVVETACVIMHQRALFHHTKLCYTQPTWLDDLFLYGLKALISDIGRNSYQSIFVVRIYGFTEGDDFLNSLNPYTRYTAPQHIEKLLEDLYPQRKLNLHNSEDVIDENLQKLQLDTIKLVTYKKNNPHYLDKLLISTGF